MRKLLSLRHWKHVFARIFRILRSRDVKPVHKLLFLVPDTLWVVANFKETQTAHVRVGQSAHFTVDGLDSAELTGKVLEIAPATGSEFTVLKADNATGNFTKVVQRLPVKIAIDADQALAQRLRAGMSVVAHVDTGSQGLQP